jgi:hypothetical protein
VPLIRFAPELPGTVDPGHQSLPLKTAGIGDGYASVVRHIGRTSGRDYETPVQAVANDCASSIARSRTERAVIGSRR